MTEEIIGFAWFYHGPHLYVFWRMMIDGKEYPRWIYPNRLLVEGEKSNVLEKTPIKEFQKLGYFGF